MNSERTEGDGYDEDGGGDRRESDVGDTEAACDGREGGREDGQRGRLKEGERGRDIVMGHPEEEECQEAISLLSAGVMPPLLHPMLNTC